MVQGSPKPDWSEATGYKITDEDIARAQRLVGYDEASNRRDNSRYATADNIRAYARSVGCDNPLFCDEDYGRATRWGSVIAPGPINLHAPLLGDPRPDEMARAKKSLFKGIHQMHSGTSWEWYRPVRPGDWIYSFSGEESVDVKQSEYGGRTVLRVSRDVKFNQDAEITCIRRTLLIYSEREAGAKRGKYMATEPASYTDDDIAAIEAIYAGEQVRGAAPRYWEDVALGDALGRMGKGPLTVSDIICMHTTGFALEPFGPMTGRIRHKHKRKMPAAYVKNDQGVPDTIMRMHWDSNWAKALGSPMAYDYGFQRECWVHHYLSDWCGDDGFVIRMKSDMRKFNYLGDFQTITGEIVGKHFDLGCPAVDARATFTNQRGEITMEGMATIALPSRRAGLPEYTTAPAEFTAKAQHFLKRHHELGGRQAG
jgi:acyl dehydratase